MSVDLVRPLPAHGSCRGQYYDVRVYTSHVLVLLGCMFVCGNSTRTEVVYGTDRNLSYIQLTVPPPVQKGEPVVRRDHCPSHCDEDGHKYIARDCVMPPYCCWAGPLFECCSNASRAIGDDILDNYNCVNMPSEYWQLVLAVCVPLATLSLIAFLGMTSYLMCRRKRERARQNGRQRTGSGSDLSCSSWSVSTISPSNTVRGNPLCSAGSTPDCGGSRRHRRGGSSSNNNNNRPACDIFVVGSLSPSIPPPYIDKPPPYSISCDGPRSNRAFDNMVETDSLPDYYELVALDPVSSGGDSVRVAARDLEDTPIDACPEYEEIQDVSYGPSQGETQTHRQNHQHNEANRNADQSLRSNNQHSEVANRNHSFNNRDIQNQRIEFDERTAADNSQDQRGRCNLHLTGTVRNQEHSMSSSNEHNSDRASIIHPIRERNVINNGVIFNERTVVDHSQFQRSSQEIQEWDYQYAPTRGPTAMAHIPNIENNNLCHHNNIPERRLQNETSAFENDSVEENGHQGVHGVTRNGGYQTMVDPVPEYNILPDHNADVNDNTVEQRRMEGMHSHDPRIRDHAATNFCDINNSYRGHTELDARSYEEIHRSDDDQTVSMDRTPVQEVVLFSSTEDNALDTSVISLNVLSDSET